MAKRKTSVATPARARPLVPQLHGGSLRVGGTGAGGRPKELLRAKLRELLTSRNGHEYVASVMDGTALEKVPVSVGSGTGAHVEFVEVPPKTRDRLYAYELLVDRGYGKPDQALQVEDERPRPTGEETMARIMELLPRVVAVLPIERKELGRLLAERRQIEVLVAGKEVRP